MLILATLSGIQDFLFDVQETGGGQARSLRARSFRIQLFAECVAMRLLEAAGLGLDRILYTAAAKVAIDARGIDETAAARVRATAAELERSLMIETHGRLRLAVALEPATDDTTPAELLERAHRRLARAKLQTYRTLAGDGTWGDATLVVPAVWRQPDEARRDRELGRRLADARWLSIRRDGVGSGLSVLGLTVHATCEPPADETGLLAVSRLGGPDEKPPAVVGSRFRPRRLARHVPRHDDGRPIEFEELAQRAAGVPYLAVMKADADALGSAVAGLIQRDRRNAFQKLRVFSGSLDRFFSETLEDEQRRADAPWQQIYTVFSGGDDMLVVGPWDVVLDFAGHVQRLFAARFGKAPAEDAAPAPLTISAGIAIVRRRYPIHLAAQQADDLLTRAKRESALGAPTSRDQCAALGEVWKWADHGSVLDDGRRLVRWVQEGIVQRGWLHTLLTLALLRRGQAGPEHASLAPEIATSRLAYHIGRNWPPRRGARDKASGDRSEARAWADEILEHFDEPLETAPARVRLLPAIVRYALLATGSATTEDG